MTVNDFAGGSPDKLTKLKDDVKNLFFNRIDDTGADGLNIMDGKSTYHMSVKCDHEHCGHAARAYVIVQIGTEQYLFMSACKALTE